MKNFNFGNISRKSSNSSIQEGDDLGDLYQPSAEHSNPDMLKGSFFKQRRASRQNSKGRGGEEEKEPIEPTKRGSAIVKANAGIS
jgi:hypothetical protein